MTKSSQPDVNAPIIGANTPAENAEQRICFTGTKTSAGSAVAGELLVNVADSLAESLLGAGSEALDGFLAARIINPVTPIDIIPIDEPSGGVAAIGSILWAGVVTTTADIEIGAGSERNGVVTVTAIEGDTAAEFATKVAAAYASLTLCIATVEVDGTTAAQNNFTYNHKGAQGNSTPLRIVGSAPGLTYTLTAMQGGAGAPVLTSTYAVLGSTRYQAMAQVGEWGIDELIILLDARWNVRNRIVDGTGFVYVSDTEANHLTALALLNQKEIVYKCEGIESKSWYTGSSLFENNFARACQAAALKALRLTTGADISAFVNAAGGVDDAQGGVEISSLPYFNTPMPWPIYGTGFGFDDVEALAAAGGATDGNNDSNTGVVYGEMVTTYKFNAQGAADLSFKYLPYVDTISGIREYCFNNIKKDAAQSRATSGGLKARRNIQNVESIRNLFIRYLADCGDLLLAQSGEAAMLYIKDNLDVSLDGLTGQFNVSIVVPIVIQARTFYIPIQMSFTL